MVTFFPFGVGQKYTSIISILLALLRQTFGLQGFVHLRASANASLVSRDIRIGFEINPDEVRPVYYGEGVSVGNREVASHQELAISQLLVDVRQPLVDVGLRRILTLVRRGLVEQRPEALVKLGADEGEPLLQPIALDRPGLRRESARRILIRQVLNDGRTLGENAAVVETQRGNVALRIHLEVIRAGFRLVLGEVYLFQFDRNAGLGGDDVR